MNVFITGATGFLGSNLVKRLIEDHHNVYVLVRSPKKIESMLKSLKSNQRKLLHIVEGELTEENLGMKEQVVEKLIGCIDVVYHSAAILSFDESKREELFRINVKGTKNVLELAKVIHAKKFIHVSTAYTLGARNVGFESLYPLESTSFINSYEESKCHAEHLAMSYQNSFEVIIMRPSIIIGDSDTGESNTTFGLYGILRIIELLKKKTSREKEVNGSINRLLINKETLSNLVPVNYVAKVLALGMIHGKKNTVYNVTNPNAPTNKAILESISEGLEYHSVTFVPYEQAHLLSDTELKMNKPLEVFREYLNRSIDFCDDNTRELLKIANEPILTMDKAMLLRIVRGFRDRYSFVPTTNY